MEPLTDFRDKEFLEQITALTEVESSKDQNAVDPLCELLIEPVGDDAVDTMVRNTLRTLLLEHEAQAISRINSDFGRIRDFCVGIVGEKRLGSAAPGLIKLEKKEDDPEVLIGVLNAMARIQAPEFLDAFRRHASSKDPLLAGIAIKALGEYKDKESIGLLKVIVSANEEDDRYERCDLSTWSAIDGLAAMDSPEALEFLVEKIHHRNPTARRLVHGALTRIGEPAVKPLSEKFKNGDTDERIMAANVLGFIGHRSAADVLLDSLEREVLDHNVAFAAYEALGDIKGMKVLVALMDNLPKVAEQSMLLAIVGALDKQIDASVGKNLLPKFKEFSQQDPDHWNNVLSAVVQSGSAELFAVLVQDPDTGSDMIELAKSKADPETAEIFRQKLAEQGDPRADLVEAVQKASDRPSMLAVDDSGAMRSFYRASADELGVDVTVAENGRVAWELLESGQTFDVMVVDMNMPEMDGIELTSRIRGKEELARTPIVMATTESEKSQAQLAKKAGVNAFLVKPFKADILANKVKKFLPEKEG